VPDVKNSYAIAQRTIENLVGIANKWSHVHAGSLGHPLCGLRILGDMLDQGSQARFD
jgi:hypothetical protein